MKVQNMTSSKENKVLNQFIINVGDGYYAEEFEGDVVLDDVQVFQSYDSKIVLRGYDMNRNERVLLDNNTWDYSKTTGTYRNIFLGESKKETQAKIDSGEYILTDLN